MRLALALMVSSERSRDDAGFSTRFSWDETSPVETNQPLLSCTTNSLGVNANKLDFISVSACWAMQEPPPSTLHACSLTSLSGSSWVGWRGS